MHRVLFIPRCKRSVEPTYLARPPAAAVLRCKRSVEPTYLARPPAKPLLRCRYIKIGEIFREDGR